METCSKIKKGAASLEEKFSREISEDFNTKEEQIFELIDKLNEGKDNMDSLIKQAHDALSKEWRYVIQHYEWAKSFVDSYKLKVSSINAEKKINPTEEDKTESLANKLEKQFDRMHDSMIAAQEKLSDICKKRKKEGEELETRINGKLEEVFKAEDARIQKVVKVVKDNIGSEDPEEVKELIRKAKVTLLKNQKYSFKKKVPT